MKPAYKTHTQSMPIGYAWRVRVASVLIGLDGYETGSTVASIQYKRDDAVTSNIPWAMCPQGKDWEPLFWLAPV